MSLASISSKWIEPFVVCAASFSSACTSFNLRVPLVDSIHIVCTFVSSHFTEALLLISSTWLALTSLQVIPPFVVCALTIPGFDISEIRIPPFVVDNSACITDSGIWTLIVESTLEKPPKKCIRLLLLCEKKNMPAFS